MQSFTIFKYQVAAALLVSHSMAVAEENKDLPLKTILDTISPSGNPSWVDDKNATILDIFGEVAKDILTNKMVSEGEESKKCSLFQMLCNLKLLSLDTTHRRKLRLGLDAFEM
jgi:hypothetical protein